MAAAVLRLPSYRRVREEDRAAALEALRQVGLEGLNSAKVDTLPLGTRRLLEVARAIAAEPAVLLLDEPASGLDPAEVLHLGVLMRRLAEAGTTVVLVEHNFQMVLDVADEIYVLAEGSMIAHGPPSQIRHDEQVIASYLGTPETDKPQVADVDVKYAEDS